MKKLLGLVVLSAVAAAAVVACGGGGGSTPLLAAASDTSLTASAPVVASVLNDPFTFPSGVPALGTTTATTVTVGGTDTAQTFKIDAGTSGTATGTLTYGSCVFAITASTFPAGSKLAANQTITVNPCNINVNTAGAQANGVAATRSVALALGSAVSSGQSITVQVDPGGALTLNGKSVGSVTLVAVTG